MSSHVNATAAAADLASLDISRGDRFQDDSIWPYFARLRREAPLHYCRDSLFGPYWSLTRYDDIMQAEINPHLYSSKGGITLSEPRSEDMKTPMFIAMDPPKHDHQRRAVSPIVAPGNLAQMEGLIRRRTISVVEHLPVGEVFDWVPRVSVELTTMSSLA